MRIKKILSLAVVLAMVLTVVPMFGITASAATESKSLTPSLSYSTTTGNNQKVTVESATSIAAISWPGGDPLGYRMGHVKFAFNGAVGENQFIKSAKLTLVTRKVQNADKVDKVYVYRANYDEVDGTNMPNVEASDRIATFQPASTTNWTGNNHSGDDNLTSVIDIDLSEYTKTDGVAFTISNRADWQGDHGLYVFFGTEDTAKQPKLDIEVADLADLTVSYKLGDQPDAIKTENVRLEADVTEFTPKPFVHNDELYIPVDATGKTYSKGKHDVTITCKVADRYSSFKDLGNTVITDDGNIKYRIVSGKSLVINGGFDYGFAGWTCKAFTDETANYSDYFEIIDDTTENHGKVFKDKGAISNADGSGSASSLSTAWPIDGGKYYYFSYTQHSSSTSGNGGIKFLGENKADSVTSLTPDDAMLGQVRLGNDGGSFGDGEETDRDYALKATTDWGKKEYIVKAPADAKYFAFREGWFSDLHLDNFELYEVEPKDIATQLSGATVDDISAETVTNVAPTLPAKVEINLSPEGTAKYFVDWTADDLAAEKFANAGTVEVNGKVRDTEIPVKANVTVKEPKDFLVAYYAFEDARFNTNDTVADSSGNGYDAKVMAGEQTTGVNNETESDKKRPAGNLSKATGKYGNAVDSGNGGIKLPSEVVNALNSGSFTISAFIKTKKRQNQSIFTLGGIKSHGNSISFFDSASGDNGRFHAEFYNDVKPEIIRTGADNDFVHVAVSYNAPTGTATVYVGDQTTSASSKTPYTLGRNIKTLNEAYIGVSSWLLGDDNKGADWWYNGLIDEFRIYATALGEKDIKALEFEVPTAPTPSLGWDSTENQFTLNFTTGEEATGIEVNGKNTILEEGKNGVAFKVGNYTNTPITAYSTVENGVIKSAAATSSIYELVVADIADNLKAYESAELDPARLKAANEVITKGGIYYSGTALDEVTAKIMDITAQAEAKTVTVTMKTPAKMGLGFLLNNNTIYIGSTDTEGTAATLAGAEDKVYTSIVINTETNTLTLAAETQEAVTLSLDSVNIEFVETLIEELEADGADTAVDFIPEL